MKTILASLFCIIVALGWATHLRAQESPLTPDEMMRRLGGDPDKARAEAEKRALTMRTPEEEANDFRAMQITTTLTDNIIANISSDDPLLLSLYTNRIGTGSGVSNEQAWFSIVDRDIRRRPEAKDLFQKIFQETNRHARRLHAMRWLAGNPDLPWGNDIMEKAIKLYRADPSKWEHAETRMLCELVRARGNESHLEFLDEINAKGIGDNGAASTIRRRLDQTGKGKTAKIAAPNIAPDSKQPPLLPPPTAHLTQQEADHQLYWLAGGVLVILIGFWLWQRICRP